MKLLGVLGVGLLAAGFCCCGSPDELVSKLQSLVGEESAPPPAPVVQATPAPVTEQIPIGVPRGALQQPVPPGAFYRYTSATLDVDGARQYHDGWFRKNGWVMQVDAQTANGWTLEAVKGDHRMTVDIQPIEGGGINVTFKLL